MLCCAFAIGTSWFVEKKKLKTIFEFKNWTIDSRKFEEKKKTAEARKQKKNQASNTKVHSLALYSSIHLFLRKTIAFVWRAIGRECALCVSVWVVFCCAKQTFRHFFWHKTNNGQSDIVNMLTDMTPSAGQFYGSQIPTMGMNITNITSHMQKPPGANVSTSFIRSMPPRTISLRHKEPTPTKKSFAWRALNGRYEPSFN